jgi:Skp family chaperone for outer membrane proteins
VFNQLNERTDAAASLKAYTQGLQGDLDKIANDLKNQEKLLDFAEGAGKKDIAVKLIEMRAGARVKKEVSEALVDQKQAEVFAAIYRKIEAASRQLAQKNGYTMVLVSDENVKVPDGPSQDTQRMISLKRFLFVDKEAHDITPDIITMMNNEYKAGVGTAPVIPGAPAPKP